jgi:hypothetical protein
MRQERRTGDDAPCVLSTAGSNQPVAWFLAATRLWQAHSSKRQPPSQTRGLTRLRSCSGSARKFRHHSVVEISQNRSRSRAGSCFGNAGNTPSYLTCPRNRENFLCQCKGLRPVGRRRSDVQRLTPERTHPPTTEGMSDNDRCRDSTKHAGSRGSAGLDSKLIKLNGRRRCGPVDGAYRPVNGALR